MLRFKSIISTTIIVAMLTLTALPVIQTSHAATTYTEYSGTLGAAGYTIRIPSPIGSWNRGLIVYCRGYMHDLIPDPMMSSNSLYNSMTEEWAYAAIANGAAFAISSYGVGGYCVQEGMDATYQLTQYAKSTYNVTGRIYIAGGSMGGNIALLLGEKYPNIYSGVLDICGAKNLTYLHDGAASVASKNDAEVTALLQSFGAQVPPYPFSLYPPQSWMTYYRNWCAQCATDMETEFGGTPSSVPQAYRNLDPLYHTNISIPVITVHGTGDALVPYAQSLQYQAAIAAANKSSLYRLYPVNGGEHVSPSVLTEATNRLNEVISWSIAIPEFSGLLFFATFAALAVVTTALFLRKPLKIKKIP